MKKNKLMCLLAMVTFASSMLIGCTGGEESSLPSSDSSTSDVQSSDLPSSDFSTSEEEYVEGPDVTYVEQRFYNQTEAPDGWTYSKSFRFYENKEQEVGTKMLMMNATGDYLLSKKFEAHNNIHVAIFVSLNGGLAVMKQGELKFSVQALDEHQNVISEKTLTNSDQFPNTYDRGNIVFDLFNKEQTICYVKIIYTERTIPSINIGVGKVKIYSGPGSETLLVDDDTYVSNVKKVENETIEVPEREVATGSTLEDYGKASSTLSLKSTGERKLLVIPVQFQNQSFEDVTGKTESEVRRDIEASFFGVEDEVGWESVSSFYYKSSYGYLNITGKVTKPFTLPCTAGELVEMNYGNNAWFALREATEWYKQNYEDVNDYDSDGDGYIDSVWMVYAQENCVYNKSGVCSKSGASDLYWAFVHRDYNTKANFSSPNAYCFGWASYDFMYEGYGEEAVDAHTFIHETGHILGLSDYYNYDRDSKDQFSPAGAIDMMDNNIVDHNAYSKFLLNWVEPTVVKEETKSITLRPFESSGDCILVPSSSFSNSPFAEYLMLEFYTPTGLNELDASAPYPGNGVQAMTQPGIKIYHVDSRLAILRYNQSTGELDFGRYIDQVTTSLAEGTYLNYAHENSGKRENYDGNRKLHILEADEANLTYKNKPITDNSLWHEGDDFGVTKYVDFKFNATPNVGEKIKWSFVISAMSADEVTITFTYLG